MTQHAATSLEQAKSLLLATTGRITKPRLAVLGALMNKDKAQSHKDIQDSLPELNRVTIYRSLDWLTKQGIIERIISRDGIRRFICSHPYDSAVKHSQHPHFQCNTCGETSCLSNMDITLSDLPPGYQLNEVSIIVAGTCPKCVEPSNSLGKSTSHPAR